MKNNQGANIFFPLAAGSFPERPCLIHNLRLETQKLAKYKIEFVCALSNEYLFELIAFPTAVSKHKLSASGWPIWASLIYENNPDILLSSGSNNTAHSIVLGDVIEKTNWLVYS